MTPVASLGKDHRDKKAVQVLQVEYNWVENMAPDGNLLERSVLAQASGKDRGEGKTPLGSGSGIVPHDHRILLGIGAVLVVVGLVFAAWAFVPLEKTKTRTIPLMPDVESPIALVDGVGFWTLLKFSLWFNGEFSGSMVATSSPGISEDSLGWKMISQSAYDSFKADGVFTEPGPLSHIGVNDTVSSVGLPTSGTYYLILVNDDLPTQEFNVTIHYRVNGLYLGFFVLGVLLVLAAIPAPLIGNRLKKRKGV